MIQDIAWSPRFVPSTTATAATDAEAIAGTNTTKFVTPANLAAAAEYAVAQVINPRAARQGLVFDGTDGSYATMGSSIATSSATVAFITDVPTSTSISRGFFSIGSSSISSNFARTLSAELRTDGKLWIVLTGATTADYRRFETSASLIASFGGKRTHFAVVRNSDTPSITLYANGVAVSGTETTGGTAPAWSDTVTGTYFVPARISATEINLGYYSLVGFYNRALSAAEVVALYEAGVPAGSDYNTASNTSKLTGANSDFSSAGNWTVTGATTISGGKLNLSNGDQAYCIPGTISVPIGAKFRVTITVDSITAGSVQVYTGGTGGWVNIATTAGTFTQEFTFSATTGTNTAINLKSVGGNAVVDTVLYYQIGLLLAPDAGQAGGGLYWYDTSGNSANITLPASGVTWNVPFAGYLTAPASTNLTLNSGSSGASFVLGQGTNGGSTLTAVGTGGFTFTQSGNNSQANTTFNSGGAIGVSFDFKRTTASASPGIGLFQLNGYNGSTRSAILEADSDGATDSGRFDFWVKATGGSLTQAMILKSNGRLLLGTGGVDSGALLQVGTDTSTSAGGMVFGTNAFLFRTTTGGIALSDNGTRQTNFYCDSGGSYIGSNDTRSLILRTNNTTALTLDSSQNATFAKNITVSGTGANQIGASGSNLGIGGSGSNNVQVHALGTFTPVSSSDVWAFHSSGTLRPSTANGTVYGFGSNFTADTTSVNVTSAAGMAVYDVGKTGANTLTNIYGIYVRALTGSATNKYAIYDVSGYPSVLSGSITTAAPTSGTAKAWKLGEVASVSPTSPNRTIRVEIDGTVYYIAAKTTND